MERSVEKKETKYPSEWIGVVGNLDKSEMSSIQRLTANNQLFNCVIIREVCGERPPLGSRLFNLCIVILFFQGSDGIHSAW